MKVVRSKIIGYCFGVSNTLEQASQCLKRAKEENCPCYSIGSLIHNEDIIESFRKRGLITIKSPNGNEKGIALIRAHGIPDKNRRLFLEAGFDLVDSTCPIVAKGASTLRSAARKGKKTIVIGVAGHAETLGLLGVEIDNNAVNSQLICSAEDAQEVVNNKVFETDEPIVVVTQTTFKMTEYNKIRKILKSYSNNIRFSNSPCGASITRVKAVTELANQTDAVIVVGGKQSENTKGLSVAVQNVGKPVFQILNEKELDEKLRERLSQFESLGICSGSSTPTYVIKAVEDVLLSIKSKGEKND